MSRKAIILLASVLPLLSASSAVAWPLSLGVKGGVSLTDAYQDNTYASSNTRDYSDSKDYIVGPFVELRLPFGLGVEADALYRPLELATTSGGVTYSTRNPTWEFPILAKYRFSFPIVKPYVEAGPSFRATGNSTNYLSSNGFTAGVGVEVKALFIRLSPELRYTRWGNDAKISSATPAYSNVNQVEFLVGLSF